MGTGFNEAEQKALVALWRDRLVSTVESNAEGWTKVWLAARKQVLGIAALARIAAFRAWGPNSPYLNYPAVGFTTSACPLRRLQERFGPESPDVRAWVQAQDGVFEQCSDGANLTVPPATDPQLRADSAYQRATAQFYSGHFDAAITAFEAIAQDTASPWR